VLPRIVIAGTSSGVGKTTIAMGILKALSSRGIEVQPFKSGPDYIDPAFHSHVTGNPSKNLDCWMLEESVVKYLFAKSAEGKGISVIEGAMGLYDGAADKSDTGSAAHLAKTIKAPVILVIDGSGASTSAAATVLGFKMFDEEVDVAGVIVNKVHGEKHYMLIKNAIEANMDVQCLGYFNKNNNINLDSRHLGLIPSVEVEQLDEKIEELAKMIEETVDLDKIIEIANRAQPLESVELGVERIYENLKLGVAYDKAFNFYYKDNLELLEAMGAELVYFSPLDDDTLPEGVDGLYIGGGFPEVFMAQLEKNKSFRESIKSAIENGMPTYAECGGVMYLCSEVVNLEDEAHQGVGILENRSVMTKRLQRFGYVNVELDSDSIIGSGGTTFRAHEFHRSVIEENAKDQLKYNVSKTRFENKLEWKCGYSKYNFVGGYAHIHFYSNLEIPKQFLASCYNYRRGE